MKWWYSTLNLLLFLGHHCVVHFFSNWCRFCDPFLNNLIRIWRANAFISWCRLKDVVIVPLSQLLSRGRLKMSSLLGLIRT